MSERVVVFLDWQNVYMRARESFHGHADDYTKGQVSPLDLGLLLASQGKDSKRELTQVRIYRGIPDQNVDQQGYGAARRQMATWSRNNKIKILSRTLRYPPEWPDCEDKPREKGIDVSLAVDLVVLGIEKQYDTAIVMSSDQDLAPAVEYVADRNHNLGVRVEVAAWRGVNGRRPNRINTNHTVYCHWLKDQQYWGLMDETDYTIAVEQPARPVPRPPSRF